MSATLIRCVATATLVVGLAMEPAVAQIAPTMGRSITTLVRVKLKGDDGKHLLLGSRVAPGKPTLIAFWASWCPPCIAEAPRLADLRRRYGDRYNFIYVDRRDSDPDPRQPAAAVAQFIARSGMIDGDVVTADVAAYTKIVGADVATIPPGIIGIPRVYLFDRQGRQTYTTMGFSEARSVELERRLEEAMNQ